MMSDSLLLFLKISTLLVVVVIYYKKKWEKEDRALVKEAFGFLPKGKFLVFKKEYLEDFIMGVSWQYSDDEIERIIKKDKLYTLYELKDMKEREEFYNLLDLDENMEASEDKLLNKSIRFINIVRGDFQSECNRNCQIYFEYQSGVNWFKVLWIDKNVANYLKGDVWLTGYASREEKE